MCVDKMQTHYEYDYNSILNISMTRYISIVEHRLALSKGFIFLDNEFPADEQDVHTRTTPRETIRLPRRHAKNSE